MNADEDEVVHTIPVYLSQAFAQQLYIFQYPTRPGTEDCFSHDVVRSSIKPQLQEVEIEESLDTNTSYFDKSQAETLAYNADGTTSSSSSKVPKIFPRGLMDRIILKSTKAVIDPSTYAVGFLKDGELHLSPLQGVVSLRPSFTHLDKSDKRQTDEIAGEEPEEEAKQVQVKFARQENERTKRLREQSYDYHSKMIAGEPWFHTKYYQPDSERAELARNKLLCSNRSGHSNKLSLDSDEYLQYLLEPSEEATVEVADPSGIDKIKNLSRRDIRRLGLPDQVRILVKEAKVLSTRHLLSLLGSSHDVQTVIKVVQTVAVMVRGNWVVRSDILYPRDTTSALNGVPADIMCRSRDYVLSLFIRHRYVDRMKVSNVLRIPPEELLEILEGLSVLRRGKGWVFRLPFDRSFAERFPDVVQRQDMWWEAKNRQLSEALKHKSQTPPSSPVKPRTPRSTGRRRDSSVSSSDGEGLMAPSRQLAKS